MPVEADSHRFELVRYIHLNLVRARMVAAPEDYPYSGHLAYLGRRAFAFLTTDWVLAQFDARLGVARRRYARFVKDGMAMGVGRTFTVGETKRGSSVAIGLSNAASRRQGKPSGAHRCSRGVIATVWERLRVRQQDLARAGRNRLTARARATIGWVALSAGAAALTQIAGRFGRDTATLSRQVAEIEK